MNPQIVGKRILELMREYNIEDIYLANEMHLTIESLQNKLNGEEEFFLNEMYLLKDIFHLNNEKCFKLFFEEENKLDKKKSDLIIKITYTAIIIELIISIIYICSSKEHIQNFFEYAKHFML